MLGNDVARHRISGEKASDIVHFLQLVLLARFDRNHVAIHSRSLVQILTHILRVNVFAIALLFPGALDLDDADRANVFSGFSFVVARLLFEKVPALRGAQ